MGNWIRCTTTGGAECLLFAPHVYRVEAVTTHAGASHRRIFLTEPTSEGRITTSVVDVTTDLDTILDHLLAPSTFLGRAMLDAPEPATKEG